MTRIDQVLFKGLINKQMRVVYQYIFDTEGDFPTIKETSSGKTVLQPSFALTISEGFEKNYIFIPSNRYFQFVLLLEKTIDLISNHLYELFPDLHKTEFEIDTRTLERFQTEKAMSSGGITMVPCVWVDETNACYPAIRIESLHGTCVVPFEDGMALSKLTRTFDPINFGLSLMRILGKIN